MKDNLTALVHFIEVGNGFCTFQLRGLEFKGTICQDREVAAMEHATDESAFSRGCEKCVNASEKIQASLCPHRNPGCIEILNFKTMVELRYQTWEVINTELILDTYNVIQNPAERVLASYDQRNILIT